MYFYVQLIVMFNRFQSDDQEKHEPFTSKGKLMFNNNQMVHYISLAFDFH